MALTFSYRSESSTTTPMWEIIWKFKIFQQREQSPGILTKTKCSLSSLPLLFCFPSLPPIACSLENTNNVGRESKSHSLYITANWISRQSHSRMNKTLWNSRENTREGARGRERERERDDIKRLRMWTRITQENFL